MKSLSRKLLSIALLSSILLSCVKEDDYNYYEEKIENYNIDSVSYCELENEILILINNHRESMGLNKLSTLNIISKVSDGHTNYMIESGKISHDNFGERTQELMNNVNAKSVGENVAYGYTTAKGVVNGWLNSDSHRKVIENPHYTDFGISTNINEKGINYFTQMFIKK